jgi:hypothetical protein
MWNLRIQIASWLAGNDFVARVDYQSTAIELARREQECLSLASELERLHKEINTKPSNNEVQLLKTQVDQLSLQYQRRQVYNTLPLTSSTVHLDAQGNSPYVAPSNHAPQPNRARDFSNVLKTKLTSMYADEYKERQGWQPEHDKVGTPDKPDEAQSA